MRRAYNGRVQASLTTYRGYHEEVVDFAWPSLSDVATFVLLLFCAVGAVALVAWLARFLTGLS